MTYTAPPLKLPGVRALELPITRPFNIHKDCVLCLLPDINTKWLDYSKYGNHATNHGATLRNDGRYGPCFYLDGTNDYLEIADDSSLDLTGNMSVEVWAKPHTVDTFSTIVVKGTAANWGLDNYTLALYEDWLHFKLGRDGDVTGDTHLTMDKWYHLVATAEPTAANALKLYINGEFEMADDRGMNPLSNANALRIGTADTTQEWFNGCLDVVRIWNRYLKPWEVKSLYNMGVP